MTNTELLLEIGSEAYDELTAMERAAILSTYTAAQSAQAGLAAFKLLMKKFKPSYRMGKTYEALSDKFEAYRRIYNLYCQTVSAGTTVNVDADEALDATKFTTDDTDEDAD